MRSIVLVALATLAACAPAPDDIKAWHYDPAGWRDRTCPALTVEYAAIGDQLAALSNAQNEKRQGDTAGMLIVGMPLGSMSSSSNIEGSIAEVKGKKTAIAAALAEKNCPGNWK